MSDYLLDKTPAEAQNRLAYKEEIQDPVTISLLREIAIDKEWQCLELGGGAGSIASWLCKQLSENGTVTVIDQDTRLLKQLHESGLNVLEADIADYDFGDEQYDLIHGRDILMHIGNRDEVLQRLFLAVKEGGWILLEEPDVSADTADPSISEVDQKIYSDITDAIYRYLQEKGVQPYYGSSLLGEFIKNGLTSIRAEGNIRMFVGGTDRQEAPHVTAFKQLSAEMIKNKILTVDDFFEFFKLFEKDGFAWREGFTISVLGRKSF